MKNLTVLFSVIIALSIFSCKDNPKNEPEVVTVDNSEKEKKTYEIAKGEAEFNDANVEAIFNQYIRVQAALVNTDAAQTQKECTELVAILNKTKKEGEILNAASAMANSSDIKTQRELFVPITKEVENMLNGALKSGTLYKQYCPMAFNNTGAYWISSSKDILNPYFGDKMLKCGRVSEEITVQ